MTPVGQWVVRLEGVTKQFGRVEAARDLSFAVSSGEIFALLGPSGSGKTTALRLIAGLERPDSGEIRVNEALVAGDAVHVPPEKRRVGMVFQDYALFPHLNVVENVTFGLMGIDDEQKDQAAEKALDLVGLGAHGDRFPYQLSGGEQQRVALARALAPGPVVLLLDEPFGNLDADMRALVRREVVDILRRAGTTTVFVTHDQEEALSIASRVGVIDGGQVRQIGTPDEIYHQPVDRFVARFVGHADFLPGEVRGPDVVTEVASFENMVGLSEGSRVEVMIRPDDVDLIPADFAQCEVVEREFKGSESVYAIRLPSGRRVHSSQPSNRVFKVGTRVLVVANLRRVALFAGDQLADEVRREERQAEPPIPDERVEALLEKLRKHLRLEEEEVVFYADGLNRSENVVLNLLYQTFVEDSRRHMRIVRAIITYLQSEKLPRRPLISKVEHMQQYLAQEEAGAIVAEEMEMTEDPFVRLLLMGIAHDEEKHARLVEGLIKLMSSISEEEALKASSPD